MRRGAPTRRPVSPRAGSDAEKAAVRAWVRILALQKRALAAVRDELERDMTLPRFDLLANLVRSDGQTLASLSRSMLVTAGNLTGLVDRAARDGLVERRADPTDRRAWRVHLTAKGQRAFREAERRHAARVTRLFAGLSPAELTTLMSLLDKVRDQLRGAEFTPRAPRGGGSMAHAGQPAHPRPKGSAGRGTRRRARPKPEPEENP